MPVTALGVVLLHGYRDQALQQGVEHGRAQAAVIEEMAIAPALRGTDLSRGLSPVELDRLQSATDLAIFNGSVARLRLRTFSGQVVFSDDGIDRSTVRVSDPGFRTAVDGGTAALVLHDPRVAPGLVIRVLQPILASTSGQATGVLEVYLPYDAIAEKVRTESRRTLWTLLGGLGALYLLLALVSWYTTLSLRRHAASREYQALHDGLTGLPNREWFRHAADDAVAESRRRGETGALVLVDLDRFKEVNDTLGHHAGDELLKVAAGRLATSVRTDDAIARLGGDEFGLILPRVGDATTVVELLTRVREHLAEEVVIDSTTLSVEGSFGVALFPGGADNLDDLLKAADAAMYQGKRAAAGIVVHDPAQTRSPGHSLSLQGELRRALHRDELVLHYQPKIALGSDQIVGVEALVRWEHPERGLLPPGEFLPVAEQSGLIEPLTAWVLRRSLSDQTRWSSMGVPWYVAVNVSAHNLESVAFPISVTELLDELAVGPECLQLELTETALAADTSIAAQVVTSLARRGIGIAIDDFGVGYTGLRQLRNLPVAEIKIDRSFVSGLASSERDRSIVHSLIDLGHSIGCHVTAEGVETAETARWLRDAGCDYAQGFYFAKPRPWPDLVRERKNIEATTSHQSAVPEGLPT
ncbi:MAG: putative bifunctional diguanylate cyclase/phosphodiesterase [Actinomycetales bacterium]